MIMMKKKKESPESGKIYLNVEPKWYWESLHDTLIEKRECIDYLLSGYPQKTDRKLKVYRNCLRFELNTWPTIGDRDIVAIEFYNYKELTPVDSFEGWSWKDDQLQIEDGKYVLRIEFMPPYGNDRFFYYIRFTDCIVIRQS